MTGRPAAGVARAQLLDELGGLLDEAPAAVEARQGRLLDELLARSGHPIVLYGAGNLGRRTQRLLAARGLEVAAFIDNDPARWGTSVEGSPVMSVDDATGRFSVDGTAIDTIWRAEGGHDHLAVTAELRALGWSRVASFIPLYWGLGDDALPWFAIDRPIKIIREREAVAAAAHWWADERSLLEYVGQVRWRLTGDFAALSQAEPDQYFPAGLLQVTGDEIFVDCGAYIGDTMLDLARRTGSWQAYHAFEPDAESFSRLEAAVAGLPRHLVERTRLHQAATSDRRRTARFTGGGLASASLAAGGDVEVQCVAIDEVLGGVLPTFIKMDIEGGEADAITGASRSIELGRPVLAVSAYHRQADLWQLTALARRLAPESNLHLRPHNPEGFDTVLYVIPPERSVA